MNDANAPILELRRVSVNFGGVRAVHNVNLTLRPAEFVGLIGPNGAGKTTVLNMISGSVRPTEGEILFKGQSIAGRSPDQLCHLGISRTFQNIRLFPQMSVFENVALGLHSQPQYGVLAAFVRTPAAQRAERAAHDRALALLDLVGLVGHAQDRAGSLSYGLQRRLEMARAMATDPTLLLLDEPAAGMNEDEQDDLTALIRRIHAEMQYSIIMIEHHVKVVMELCADSLIYVLNLGELLAMGGPREIQNDPKVIQAYLGEKKPRNVRRQTLIP
jgi:branched-chain amino acid transport system ATP-binding protein